MTNEVSYAPIKYVCNGLSVDFAFPWKIFQAEDLIVTIQGQEGVLVLTLELEKDFTVEFDDVGGNVKTNKAWPDGTILVVARNTDDYQSKDFTTSTGFQAREIEKAFDRVSCNLQEMDYNIENFKETFTDKVEKDLNEFEDEINIKIEEVSEAAGKINALEQAVQDAQDSAELAGQKANEANQTLEDFTIKIKEADEVINEIDKNIDTLINHVSFNLFDTKTTDYILEGKEAKGWALQGTYVSKDSYPDFYNTCLAQKTNATSNDVTLGESTLTMFVNDNGHKFYNIADKSIIDVFYEAYGIADFYGIDEENERVYLPRNKYFALTGKVMGNGMSLGLTNGTVHSGLCGNTSHTLEAREGAFNTKIGTAEGSAGTYLGDVSVGVETDSTKSGIVLESNESKYLYYCVGNTEVTQAITNVTEVTTSENDTIPLFTGMYFDFKPNNVSWLKAGEQQNGGGVYKTCYDQLVEIVNGVNNYDLKVVNQADMVSGVVYDEYWILDQDNLTFRTPLTIATKSLSGAVAGNGMALGLTNGTDNFGIYNGYSGAVANQLIVPYKSIYGNDVGVFSNTESPSTNANVGITSDPTKSGIIAEQSNAQLYFKVANAVQNLELLDAGRVMQEAVLRSSLVEAQVVVETYQNGTSWYRVWSDGWCEQGGTGTNNASTVGTITTTLLKAYVDVNYTILLTRAFSTTQSLNVVYKSNNSFQAQSSNTPVGLYYWYACGYIK